MPRHKHSAVDRNRLKRRLRELARLELLPMLRALTAGDGASAPDISIRARREAYDAPFDALKTDVLTIANRTRPETQP